RHSSHLTLSLSSDPLRATNPTPSNIIPSAEQHHPCTDQCDPWAGGRDPCADQRGPLASSNAILTMIRSETPAESRPRRVAILRSITTADQRNLRPSFVATPNHQSYATSMLGLTLTIA
ncbi:hypothetical protein U1Q18_000069, partial [Sarracenia purpurea var. burkii]